MTDTPTGSRWAWAEYVADGNYDATPDEVLAECDLDESRRGQVEHYLAVTRYGMFNDREVNDAKGLAFNDVEWADVTEWDVVDVLRAIAEAFDDHRDIEQRGPRQLGVTVPAVRRTTRRAGRRLARSRWLIR